MDIAEVAIPSKEELVESLQYGVVEVKYKKVNGEERLLKCTLKPTLLPERDMTEEETKKRRIYNPEILRVFDVEKNDWRSFYFSSVLTVKPALDTLKA